MSGSVFGGSASTRALSSASRRGTVAHFFAVVRLSTCRSSVFSWCALLTGIVLVARVSAVSTAVESCSFMGSYTETFTDHVWYVYIVWGVFIIWKRTWFSRWGARSHQRVARVLPWAYWGWGNLATREDFWRVAAVPIGLFLIVLGSLIAATW